MDKEANQIPKEKEIKAPLLKEITKPIEILPPEIIEPDEMVQVQNVVELQVPMSIATQTHIDSMSVEITDLERIEDYIFSLKPLSSWYQIAFGFSSGFFANAIFALIGLFTIENPPPELINSIYILIAVSLVISVLLEGV